MNRKFNNNCINQQIIKIEKLTFIISIILWIFQKKLQEYQMHIHLNYHLNLFNLM